MNNTEINAVKEFRRFMNSNIYPSTIGIIIDNIKLCFDSNFASYETLPRPIIKFNSNLSQQDENDYRFKIYGILKNIFISYFNEAEVDKLIKNQIHLNINDESLKNTLRTTLVEIKSGNPYYLGLLCNITVLNDNNIYINL